MAFVSPIALRGFGERNLNARGSIGKTTRMEMAPLNADEAKPMKEPYSVASGKKAPICRCWQSNKFPLCDGSHNAFNKETGSHVGPLVVAAEKPVVAEAPVPAKE